MSKRVPVSVPNDRIIAVGLLTARELEILGPTFNRIWPVDETPCFTGLLEAIDEADQDLRHETNPSEPA